MLKRIRFDGDVHCESEKSGSFSLPVESQPSSTPNEPQPEEETSFAPGGDADYFAEEDEEGRFYGGGLTGQQKEILSIFEKAEAGAGHEQVPLLCSWVGSTNAL